MNAVNLMQEAEACGVRLWVEGSALKYQGPTDAVKAMLSKFREHKAELLALLSEPGSLPGNDAFRPLDDFRLLDLIFDAARENGVESMAVWAWLSADDITALRSGDPTEAATFHAAVSSACAGGHLAADGGHSLPFPMQPPALKGETGDPKDLAAKPVRCGDCRHFERDRIGDGHGIGECRVRTDPPGPALYPKVERHCRHFEGSTP